METMVVNPTFWSGKSVAVTGHTGFKGGWASLWLSSMGAKVSGLSLEPNTDPNFFELVGLREKLEHHEIGDITNAELVQNFLGKTQPEIVFHMAAQALVLESYNDPVKTIATNVLGTAIVLDACRQQSSVKTIVNVTSDKCYENNEDGRSYIETDPMGGKDIYSASKGAAELVARAFQHSFVLNSEQSLASVRAGNVIGGGDWSENRLVPDYFRALQNNDTMEIRSPNSVRPWQHVLEPVSGYLCLSERLFEHGEKFSGGWNFGPSSESIQTVKWVVEYLKTKNGGEIAYSSNPSSPEARLLSLDSSKARLELGWEPRWTITQALDATADWEQARRTGAEMCAFSLNQINNFNNKKVV